MTRSRPFHAFLAAFAIALAAPHADASNDGQLCENPLGVLLCGSLMAADALRPLSWTERMEKAATAGKADELRQLVQAHPDKADAMNLLVLAVGNMPSQVPDAQAKSLDDRLAMFAFLLDRDVAKDDKRMAPMLQTVAAGQRPRRIETLNLWFSRGLSARGVSLAERTIGWGEDGPQVLRLLVEHGADPNQRDRDGDPPLIEAVRTHNLATAELLVQLGADPNAPRSSTEPSSLMHLVSGCGQHRPCTADTLRIIEFMMAHGADPNGRAQAGGDCITPLDMARWGHDEALAALLLRYKADPDFRCAR
ncbi:ankyrin repeat domain-containing protein [Piscinibacter terrae]|uniref:Ankyrin repeat domain-containing protein n=1 Tax=Piscinibacter terrae TaxID=2496871 RepID=A0A3N7HWE4_9BURK|nr:ankyrin repeat domain-containing protein [Albitalea terrae]RQP25726.1 ankyrin repeat domain-containing protein [Albitalea terrae]